jgi:hypothetical protein
VNAFLMEETSKKNMHDNLEVSKERLVHVNTKRISKMS